MSSLGVNTPAGSTGYLYCTGDVVANYSDIRLKDNIRNITDAGKKLYSLNGIEYNHNKLANKFGFTDKNNYVGVIAQEVKKVMPEVIKRAPFDQEGDDISKSGKNYMTVQYEKLIPLIIETIKEQQEEIEKLEGILK